MHILFYIPYSYTLSHANSAFHSISGNSLHPFTAVSNTVAIGKGCKVFSAEQCIAVIKCNAYVV